MATRLPQYAAKRPYRSLHFIALYLHHPVVSFVPSLALDLGCNGIGQRCRNRARARRKPKQMDIVKADPFDEIEGLAPHGIGFSREPDDEIGRYPYIGNLPA